MSKGAADGFGLETHDQLSTALTTRPTTAAAKSTENLWYLCTTLLTLLMYTVASPDPDPNPRARGGGLLPNPKRAILRSRVELVGAQPPPIPYILGEGVNYLTLRVQFYANECNRRREANP